MKKQPEPMHSFFDARAEGYDQHMQANVVDYEEFYSSIAEPIAFTEKPLTIMDIGCGTGIELSYILDKAPNAKIYCNDISSGMLSRLKDKHSEYHDQFVFIEGSYLELNLPNVTFDYVISVMTLHHLDEKLKINLYRVLRNLLKTNGIYIEGDFVVNQVESEKYTKIYQEHLMQIARNGIYHIDIPFTVEKQLRCIRNAGFTDIDLLWKKKKAAVFVAKK